MQGLDLWKEQREKAEEKQGLKILKEDKDGKFYLHMWKPKAIKPFTRYYFKSEIQRENYMNEQIKIFLDRNAWKEANKQARKGTPEDLKKIQVGSIFSYSWGYEQTNVDFFQVVEMKNKTVLIREIASQMVESGNTNSMAGHCVAVKDKFLEGEPVKKVLTFYSGNPIISMKHGSGSLWNGEKQYVSWYA